MIDFKRLRMLIKQEEKLRWAIEKQMAKATKTTVSFSGSGSGSHRTESKVEEGAILLATLKDEYRQIDQELKQLRKELKPEIRRFRDPITRTAMNLRYINGVSVRKIAATMDYSEQHIFAMLNKTEDKINKRLKDRENTQKRSEFT